MLKQYQRIQVAVDGSKEADVAFSKAVEVAKRNGATLEILHVVDTRAFQDVSSFDSAMVEQVSEEAKPKSKNIIIVLKMPVLKMFIILLNLVLQRILLLMNFLKNTILI